MALLAHAMHIAGSRPWRPQRDVDERHPDAWTPCRTASHRSGTGPLSSHSLMTAGRKDCTHLVLRAGRKQVVRDVTAASHQPGGARFLQSRTVTSRTRERYERAIDEFMTMNPAIRDILRVPAARLDPLVNDFVHQLYYDGISISQAKLAVYGLLWRRSEKIASLPLAQHALRGFSYLEPDTVRNPMTGPETCLLAEHIAKHMPNGPLIAAFMLIAFDSYARVGELLRATARGWCYLGRQGQGENGRSSSSHPASPNSRRPSNKTTRSLLVTLTNANG